MDKYLLTEEEIYQAERIGVDSAIKPNPLGEIYKAIAKAQVAKVLKVLAETQARQEQAVQKERREIGEWLDMFTRENGVRGLVDYRSELIEKLKAGQALNSK